MVDADYHLYVLSLFNDGFMRNGMANWRRQLLENGLCVRVDWGDFLFVDDYYVVASASRCCVMLFSLCL